MISIAVCDDDPKVIERIECYFDKLNSQKYEYDVFFSGNELLDYKKTQNINYNLYILDIEMKNLDGITLAKNLRISDPKALFIFLTGYSQYVYDVFEVITFDFIRKPIEYDKFIQILNKASSYLKLTKSNFTFSYRKNRYNLACEDIIYIEKKGRKAFIHTNNKVYQFNMTLGEIWSQLDEHLFTKIHSSYIINMEYIREIVRGELTLKTDEVLYISRNYRQKVKLKHLEFLNNKL